MITAALITLALTIYLVGVILACSYCYTRHRRYGLRVWLSWAYAIPAIIKWKSRK